MTTHTTNKLRLAAVAILLFIVAIIWILSARSDQRMAELDRLQSQLMDSSTAPEKRTQLESRYKEIFDALPPNARQGFVDHQVIVQQEKALNDFFAMPKAKQEEAIDNLVKSMQRAQSDSQYDTSRRVTGTFTPVGGPVGAHSFGLKDGKSPEVERQKRMLDRYSSKQRARQDEYQRMINQRMPLGTTRRLVEIPLPMVR